MGHHESFLGDLGMVLVVASVASVAFRLIGLPSLLGYLVAGLAVGPYIPIPIFADPGRVESLAEFGVVLVMFSVGLEFSLARLAAVVPKAGFSAIVQMSGLAFCGYVAGEALGFSTVESMFLGAGLSVSSTMVVARVFGDQDVSKDLRDLVFGILVVQDIVAVALITVLTAIASGSGVSGSAILGVVLALLGVLAAMIIGGLLIVPRMVRAIVRLGSVEVTVVSALGLCFGFAILAGFFGYSVALGAFLAGMLVAESGRGKKIEHLVAPLRDLFAAVFFVSIGMMVEPTAAFQNLHIALAIAGLVVVARFGTVTVASVFGGNGLRKSVRAGIYLGQIGEFSFIMITIGTAAGVVEGRLLSILVTVAALTTFTTPMLGRVSERLAEWIDRKLPRRIQTILSLYEKWFETLRSTGFFRPRARAKGQRIAIVLGVDVAALIAITICTSLFEEELGLLLHQRIGWGMMASEIAIMLVAIVLALPFGVGLLRSSRSLAQLLAQRIFPSAEDSDPAMVQGVNRVDLGHSPRRMLTVAFQLMIFLAVGIPFVAVTVPFLPLGGGIAGFVLLISVLGIFLWRDASQLQGHVRAGAEVLIEMLASQRASESGIFEAESVLPGFDGVSAIEVEAGTVGSESSLADLNLRAKTGATVVAIQRGETGVAMPNGHETLQSGDLLAITGTQAAVEAARQLLEQQSESEAGEDTHSAGSDAPSSA